MTITNDEIVSITEPKDSSGLFRIMYKTKEGITYPADMTEKEYKVRMMELRMKLLGYNMEIIEEYKELLCGWEDKYDDDEEE